MELRSYDICNDYKMLNGISRMYIPRVFTYVLTPSEVTSDNSLTP